MSTVAAQNKHCTKDVYSSTLPDACRTNVSRCFLWLIVTDNLVRFFLQCVTHLHDLISWFMFLVHAKKYVFLFFSFHTCECIIIQ